MILRYNLHLIKKNIKVKLIKISVRNSPFFKVKIVLKRRKSHINIPVFATNNCFDLTFFLNKKTKKTRKTIGCYQKEKSLFQIESETSFLRSKMSY
jgi:hypothetical protein